LLHAQHKFINTKIKLSIAKPKVKHRNGVNLKLGFDPRKNMSAFTYLTAKINSKKYFVSLQ